jgi:hypothetical protein
MRFDWVDADSLEDVEKRAIYSEDNEESTSLEGDNPLVDILIINSEHVQVVDIPRYQESISKRNFSIETEEFEKKEREELKRLQFKYQ